MSATSPETLLQQIQDTGAAAELFQASSDTLEVEFTAGEVKGALARETSGLGLRAQRDGKAGFVCSRDLSADAFARLTTHVESSLEVGDPVAFAFPGPAKAEKDDLQLYCAETAALRTEDLVATGTQAIEALKQRFPDVTFDASVRRSVGDTSLRNSAGQACQERYSVFSFSIEANRTQDEDVLLDWASVTSTTHKDADPQRAIDELSQRLGWAEKTVSFKPGRMPVLLTPSGSLVLWSPLLQALSGKTVMLGTSPLRERVGEAVLSEQVTVIDDGLKEGALGSSAYDDEGVPRQTRALIDKGVLRGFVHDLETAAATGSEPTGNGERGGATARPQPGFSNVVIQGGEQTWRELLASIDYGVLVHRVIGRGQGNTLPGTFSNPLDLAFLIEGGEVKGRIRDGSIAGNVYELLTDAGLRGLSREPEQIGGSLWVPWTLLNEVNVVGKEAAADADAADADKD